MHWEDLQVESRPPGSDKEDNKWVGLGWEDKLAVKLSSMDLGLVDKPLPLDRG